MSKNVLYISYDGMTDPLGQSQVLPYICGLSKLGYKYTLISFEKEDVFTTNKSEIEKICLENHIDWLPQSYTKSPPVLSTLYDIYQLFATVKKLAHSRKIDIVHCRSYIAAFAGIYLQKHFQCKFLFDMRGFWVNERVDGNIWNLKNPLFKYIYSYFKKKEIEFFSKADYTISLTYNGRDEIHSWDKISNQPIPIEVIPCCVDTQKFDYHHIEESELVKYRKLTNINPNDFVLSYVGSIGTWYMTDEMMQFYQACLSIHPQTKLLFISNSSKEEVFTYATKNKVPTDNIIVIAGKRNDMPYLISLSTFSLFFIKPLYSKKASSPTKQGEIMSLGIPIICNANVGDTASIINKYHAGFVIDQFNASTYTAVATKLKHFVYNKQEIRNGALEFYDLSKGIERYASVYAKLLK